MKDFEQIYNEIYLMFKDKIEIINENQRDINKYVFYKLIKLIIIIAIIFFVLILTTKNMELLVFLIFVPAPLFIYYGILKGERIRTSIIPDMELLDQRLYSTLVSEGFNGLRYSNNKKGINEEIYNKGRYKKYEKYDEYYSESEIEGILNNENEIKMSYVSTSRGKTHRKDFVYTFGGYFLEVELNISTRSQIKIDEKKIEYLDNQIANEETDIMANNIQNILKQFKKKCK